MIQMIIIILFTYSTRKIERNTSMLILQEEFGEVGRITSEQSKERNKGGFGGCAGHSHQTLNGNKWGNSFFLPSDRIRKTVVFLLGKLLTAKNTCSHKCHTTSECIEYKEWLSMNTSYLSAGMDERTEAS